MGDAQHVKPEARSSASPARDSRLATRDALPILVTLDVHPVPGMGDYVAAALERFEDLGVTATFFITASVIEAEPWVAGAVLERGHEIGSHGLIHNDQPVDGYPPERYDLLEEADQRRFFEEAAAKFETLVGRPMTSFRSPCFGLSGPTVRLLEAHGFLCDLSVNSQRLDFLSSNPFSCNHMLAPRLPYHPSHENPYRRGDSRLWEIPVSSFVVPFVIMTLITFRYRLTRAFFSALARESRRTGKPVVYMVHPEEFSPTGSTYTIPMGQLRFRDFLPRRGTGIRARQALRMSDPAKIHDANLRLLEHMTSIPDARFVTATDYVQDWLEAERDAESQGTEARRHEGTK